MAKSLQRLIVQVHMSELDLAIVQRLRIHGKTVVMRGDLDLSRNQVLDRLVPSSMPELELIGLPPQGQPQELVAQTDPEQRSLPY